MRPLPATIAQATDQSDTSSSMRRGDTTNVTAAKLRGLGLRPSRARLAIAHMLFTQGNRHVSAEMLFEEASRARVSVSLATIYNALRDFTEIGLLRQVAVDSSKTYFDTNNSEHHHYYLEDRRELMDIPSGDVVVGRTPAPPDGFEVARIDVVVRLRRKPKMALEIFGGRLSDV
jgi:Fur family transcriptional regulator, iron response regulator